MSDPDESVALDDEEAARRGLQLGAAGRRGREALGRIWAERDSLLAQVAELTETARGYHARAIRAEEERDALRAEAGAAHDNEEEAMQRIARLEEALERAWGEHDTQHGYCSAFSPELERNALSQDTESQEG